MGRRQGAGRCRLVAVGHASLGQVGLNDIARLQEFGLADRVELQSARLGIGDNHDRRRGLRLFKRRIDGRRQLVEQREIADAGQQEAGQDNRLAADAIRQPAEHQEEGRGQDQGRPDQDVGRIGIDMQQVLQEEQRVKLTAIPDDALTGDQAKQGQQHDLQVFPLQEGLGEWRLGQAAFVLHRLENRAFIELHANPHRHQQQDDREQERHAPAPGLESFFADFHARDSNQYERQQQPEGRRRLDPRRHEAAIVRRSVLSDIGRGATIFTAQRQALQKAEGQQGNRRGNADLLVIGQKADSKGRQPHDDHGEQEGRLATDQITDVAKHESAERAHNKAGGKGHQRENETRGLVDAFDFEEVRADRGRQCRKNEEIEPFENGAERRSAYHQKHAALFGSVLPCHFVIPVDCYGGWSLSDADSDTGLPQRQERESHRCERSHREIPPLKPTLMMIGDSLRRAIPLKSGFHVQISMFCVGGLDHRRLM